MSLTDQTTGLMTQGRRLMDSTFGQRVQGRPGLIASYVLSRLVLFLIPLGLFIYPGGTLLGTDIHLYWTWAEVLLSGHYPIADPMWQYPPLAGFVFVLGTKAVIDPMLSFMILALAVDATIFTLLYRRARSTDSLAGPWTYVLAGLAVGPVLLTRFDLFPTLFAVAALLTLSKPVRSGALLAVGALLKVWPAFLIVAYRRRALPRAVAGFAAVAVVATMWLVSWGPNAGSFLSEQGQRGIQIESVGAAPFVLANFFGYDLETVFRYGSLEIDASGAGLIGSVLTLAGFVAIGYLAYRRLRGRLENVQGADIALVIVLVSISTSRVFSPQYMIWVAGIAAVCMLSRETLMKPIVYLTIAVSVLGQLVYPANYGSMMEGSFWGVSWQLARIGLLVLATVWAYVKIIKAPSASQSTPPAMVSSPVTTTDQVPLRVQ